MTKVEIKQKPPFPLTEEEIFNNQYSFVDENQDLTPYEWVDIMIDRFPGMTREKIIENAKKEIDFENLKKMNYYDAKQELTKVFGIGNKVADCIMLFSLEKLEAFPLDTWILKILQKYYSSKFYIKEKITKKEYENTHQQVLNHFGIYSGYSQQFLFKMERDLNEKKWL